MLPVQSIIDAVHTTPRNGVSREEAAATIADFLDEQKLITGDFRSAMKLTGLTTQEIWENARLELFRVRVEYAWLDGLAVFVNGTFVSFMSGQQIDALFAADLDDDGVYDLCVVRAFGSGIVSSFIQVFGSGMKTVLTYDLRSQFKDVLVEPDYVTHRIRVYENDISAGPETKHYLGYLGINKAGVVFTN